MSDTADRSSKILIKEAELIHASNDFIHAFFFNKALGEERIEMTDLDSDTEFKLLEKNDDFIDLTLAQYCLYDKTIEKLFAKAISNNNLPLKLACLTNRTIGRREWSFNKLPDALFGSDSDKLANWFSTITTQELNELFRNETIDDGFLTHLLETENALWKSLTEENQIFIIHSLYYNTRVCKNYEGPMDGYAEYLHGKLFTVIWDLAKKVPVTKAWGRALGGLLEKTKDDRYEFNSMEVVKRWMVKDEDEDGTEKKSYLNSFESVRFAIYKNVIKDLYGKDKTNQTHFENEDIAYRACAYQHLRMLKVDDIKAAYEKDKLIAVEYLMNNYNIWRKEELRNALKEICWDADEKYNDYHLDCANMFNWKEEDLTKKYPDWFADNDTDLAIDDDEKILNYGMAKELIKENTFEQSVEFFKALNELQTKVNDQSSTIKWIFYGTLIVLATLFFKH